MEELQLDRELVAAVRGVLRERVVRYVKSDYEQYPEYLELLKHATANVVALERSLKGDCTVVSVYAVSRNYGGPEEGGWWYDWYELAEAALVVHSAHGQCRVEVCKARQAAKYEPEQPAYSRFSVLGNDPEFHVVVEDWVGEHQSIERPRYE